MDAALEEAYCGSDVGSFVHRPVTNVDGSSGTEATARRVEAKK